MDVAEAARKLETYQEHETRPTLRVVADDPRRARVRRTSARTAPRAFRACALGMLLVFGLALLRVNLAVGAEQDAIDASRLQASIKNEQQMAKSLEASKSSLAAPSRIASIASGSLDMKAPAKVSYMTFTTSKAPAATVAKASGVARSASGGLSGAKKLVASAMDLAAGEAQVLLVGDVGLASAK